MSYQCINPNSYQGDPGFAPEFESDDAVECVCGAVIDLDEDVFVEMEDGTYRCEGCLVVCPECGETITGKVCGCGDD